MKNLKNKIIMLLLTISMTLTPLSFASEEHAAKDAGIIATAVVVASELAERVGGKIGNAIDYAFRSSPFEVFLEILFSPIELGNGELSKEDHARFDSTFNKKAEQSPHKQTSENKTTPLPRGDEPRTEDTQWLGDIEPERSEVSLRPQIRNGVGKLPGSVLLRQLY